MKALHHAACAAVVGLFVAGGSAQATETIDLTIAARHPATVPWVSGLKNFFMPEVDRQLEAAGGNYKIDWQEAFGGQLYNAGATLTSVGDGVTDIGWVFVAAESSRMPLNNLCSELPFLTPDATKILPLMRDMTLESPALQEEWKRANAVFLGVSGRDTFDLFTKDMIRSFDELQGKKLLAPAAFAPLLEGTGAVLVDGALPTYYTSLQTGVADGAMSMATGFMPIRAYEVAPKIAVVDMGAGCGGAVAMNADRWADMPEEVQAALLAGGKLYTEKHAEQLNQLHEVMMKKMQEAGADAGVEIFVWPEAERVRWAEALPPIGTEWKARHPDDAALLDTYMNGLRAAGVEPLRQWDKE